MEEILNLDKPTNVALLDTISQTMVTGTGAQVAEAQRVLTQFQEHPDSWQRVPLIIAESQNMQTKYVALQVLDKLIKTRWKGLPDEQRQGIRNFVISSIMETSSSPAGASRAKSYLTKLNLLLVDILKQDWPQNWPNFIPEIVESAHTSESVCENNMVILKLLSEEIFDFSQDQLTSAKINDLKTQICCEFAAVFHLCSEILAVATNESLIHATLGAMLRFLGWIPYGFIFETNVIDVLVQRFLEPEPFRNVTLKCLSEIASLKPGPEYDAKFVILFNIVMTSVNRIIPPSVDLAQVYPNSSDEDQELIMNLALFLSNMLGNHLAIFESQEQRDVLQNAHKYLIKISQVEEREIFKITLEYWTKFVAGLYDDQQRGLLLGRGNFVDPVSNLLQPPAGASSSARFLQYRDILEDLRYVIVEHMAKPEEVLIVENDEGEIVREFMKESDTIVLYKTLREILVFLTHLDVENTEYIMTEKLRRQVDGSEWSWTNINRLCWAIGSISGTMSEDSEKRFLVTVIKNLLSLTEQKRGKDNKAVVASNIMYIVGQYPRFLRAHWKFLKTVVKKLFEFAHETHEGVQDMACDTFIKIAQKCKRKFVFIQAGEAEPFIDDILRNLDETICDLQPLQVHTFYEAVGYIISAQPDPATRDTLLAQLMSAPNLAWQNVLANPATITESDSLKILANVLKTNVSVCVALGHYFLPQLTAIYMDMLTLYRTVSSVISQTTAERGLIATKMPHVRLLRSVKKDTLHLVSTFISKCEDLDSVYDNLVPPLLEAILTDYKQNIPEARDAEVLSCMASVVSKMGARITAVVPSILDAVFEPSLNMINRDFSEYPEHRVAFYKMLRAITNQCFPALLSLPAELFSLYIQSITWAMKHDTRSVTETGLVLAIDLVNLVVAAGPDVLNPFFQTYYESLIHELLYVITEVDQKGEFQHQVSLFSRLLILVNDGTISAPLFDPATHPGVSTNQQYLATHLAELFYRAFPHLRPAQVEEFVANLFANVNNLQVLATILRDFLIQVREHQGQDISDILQAEQEQERLSRQKEEHQKALAIPGMINPADIDAGDEL